MSRHYELSVPSDGQTIDTGYGPVDTIVIERALRGLPAQPTQAEASYLMALIPPGTSRTLATRIAEALGVRLESVERRARRHHNAADLSP